MRPSAAATALCRYYATTPRPTDTKAERRNVTCSPVLAVKRAITSATRPWPSGAGAVNNAA